MDKVKTEFIADINRNNSSKTCSPCTLECKKIDNKINGRDLSEIKYEEVPHILKLFDF